MKEHAILAIDMGSAFTKVAVRGGWNQEAALVKNIPLATAEETYCVPSVVARAGGKWVIGRAAAEQVPGPGVTVYRNWKAGLFTQLSGSPSIPQEGSRAPTLSQNEAIDVGIAFLQELRGELVRTGIGNELLDLPVRLCIPHLSAADGGRGIVEELLNRSGWGVRIAGATIYEPEANALGLISRGRNATWVPNYVSFQPWLGRCPDLKAMIEPPLSTMFRAMRGQFGLLVTDIGAFTTDFGYIRFDASFSTDDWNKPEIVQSSVRLGIHDLDSAVVSLLPAEAQDAIAAVTPDAWERLKRRLYLGTSVALRGPSGGMIVVGEGSQSAQIRATIHQFADRVWRERELFIAALQPNPMQGEAFTGGGSLIPDARELLFRRLQESGRRWSYDLLDDSEPRQQHTDTSGFVDEAKVERLLVRNRELVRGGSAMGACSVFFG